MKLGAIAIVTLGLFASFVQAEEKSVSSVLAKINTDHPDAECPECGADKEFLLKQARMLRDAVSKINIEMNERLRKAKHEGKPLTDLDLAEQAVDQTRLLKAEVDRQKMLNRLKEMDVAACTDRGADGKSGRTRTAH